jgi:type VI secretion system protein ImpA
MASFPFDPQPLLGPLGDDAPCGPDLEYDAAYIELEQAGASKPERQFGDTIYPEPPDWPVVYEKALALSGRTRDLRVAMWLLRSASRLHGLAGYSLGLSVVSQLLQQYWPQVHPQLDASDGNDPTMRVNALAPLIDPDAGLADLRAAAVAPVRGGPTVRDVELGLGGAQAHDGETVPTEGGITAALQGLREQHPQIVAQAAQAHAQAEAMDAALRTHLQTDQTPVMTPVLRLLALLKRATAGAPAGDEAGAAQAEGSAPAAAATAVGSIRSRADAVRELERICEWIERHEPTNPAPLLIRRAQRLMDMSFMEIIRDLAPDGLGQVERIAGSESSS